MPRLVVLHGNRFICIEANVTKARKIRKLIRENTTLRFKIFKVFCNNNMK